MNTEIALVARQPIYDRRLDVVGYEVLYRTAGAAVAQIEDPDLATATVSINALLELGLDSVVHGSRAWINVTRGVLVSRAFEFLPPERVVLEVLETVCDDDDVLEALARAKSLGYRIALDDFVLHERSSRLVPFADTIKIDVLGADRDALHQAVRTFARPGLELLAEKVETHAMFEQAAEAGFSLFQGYFFARPATVETRRLPADRMQLLRTVARLNDEHATIAELEQLVAPNLALSVQVLRYVNSAAGGVSRRIESVHHAIVMLGLTRLRACVMMLMMTSIDGKPHELVLTALVRARLCQLLGEVRGDDPQPYFTAGLLSVIDAFMDQPMESLVPQLSLSRQLEAALMRREGALGEALDTTIACEAADWDRILSSGIQEGVLKASYLRAIAWAHETDATLTA